MRNADFGLRYTLAFIAVILNTAMACAAERMWTRSEILTVADKEAQRLGYNVEQMSVSFGWYKVDEWCQSDDTTWAILYRPLTLSLGGDLCIVIDRESGKVISTKTGE